MLGQVNKILLAQFPHLHKDGFNHAACLTVFMTIKQSNLCIGTLKTTYIYYLMLLLLKANWGGGFSEFYYYYY